MKQRYIYSILLILLFSSTLILAQDFQSGGGFATPGGPLDTLGKGIEQIFDWLSPLLEVILGEQTPSDISTSSDFIIRILLFTIIFCLIWTAVTRIEMFNAYPAIEWILTIAISILATRWFASNPELVQTVLLPYNVVGISLTAFLPLVIYFFFLEVGLQGRKNRSLRKFGWIFFACIFVFLWISRTTTVVDQGGFSESGLLIYPISAGLCVLFSFMDRSIQSFFQRAKVDQIAAGADRRLAISLMAQRKDIEKILEGETNEYTVKKLKKQLDDIDKQLIDLESR